MRPVKVAVIYYSATGTNYQLASVFQQAAEEVGAEVRLRKVRELAPTYAIDRNPEWRARRSDAACPGSYPRRFAGTIGPRRRA